MACIYAKKQQRPTTPVRHSLRLQGLEPQFVKPKFPRVAFKVPKITITSPSGITRTLGANEVTSMIRSPRGLYRYALGTDTTHLSPPSFEQVHHGRCQRKRRIREDRTKYWASTIDKAFRLHHKAKSYHDGSTGTSKIVDNLRTTILELQGDASKELRLWCGVKACPHCHAQFGWSIWEIDSAGNSCYAMRIGGKRGCGQTEG